MPIYDNNGTTSQEIGKLYDNNGTTSSQISKVYDNNGTTSSLIYSGIPDYLFKSGDNIEYTGGWTSSIVSNNTTNYYALADSNMRIHPGTNGNSTIRIFIHTRKPIDVTNINAISVNLTTSVGVWCKDTNTATWFIYWGIALTTSYPNASTMDIRGGTSNKITKRVYHYVDTGPSLPKATIPASTLTLNTTSYTGSHYVLLFVDGYDVAADGPFITTNILCY